MRRCADRWTHSLSIVFSANRREFPLLLDQQVYLDFEIADKVRRSIGLILKALPGPLGTVVNKLK